MWTPDRIRKLREAMKMTQEEIGERCGYDRSAVCAWEKGRRSPNGAASLLLDQLETRAKSLGWLK